MKYIHTENGALIDSPCIISGGCWKRLEPEKEETEEKETEEKEIGKKGSKQEKKK